MNEKCMREEQTHSLTVLSNNVENISQGPSVNINTAQSEQGFADECVIKIMTQWHTNRTLKHPKSPKRVHRKRN